MSQKILIIEDDPVLGDVLTQKLGHEGYQVTLIPDGAEGLAAITSVKPDLVLLDIILPTMSGYEILEKKHADPAISAIPVIIVSNSGQPVEITRALALGVNDYLVKAQFDPEEVLSKVRTCLSAPYAINSSSPSGGGQLVGKKVMWVEDDVFLNDILAKKLTTEGCTPMNARDGEEALKLLESDVPDILLLDLVLPGMSGFDVLEKIKADERLKNIPVLVFSNLGQQSEIEKAKKLGALKHFIKAEMDVSEIVTEILAVVK
jgi:DNA-binding response OmpR family regulator